MTADGRTTASRDRTTVRRALRAGVVVWVLTGVPLVAVVAGAEGDGAAGLVAVMMGLVVGSVVASAWLMLAAALDLLAHERPGRRRVLWTVGVVVFTFASPLLVVAAQAAR